MRQRSLSAIVSTKTVVARLGTESLFWRFRLLVDGDRDTDATTSMASTPATVAKIEPRPIDAALRILVLSQDADTIAMFDAASRSCNGVVETAPNIRAAVTVLRSFPADIVVADLWSDGHLKHDIIAELRLVGHRPMPLGIALSGVSASDSTYALKTGFHSFLMKPISLESAENALQTITRVLLKRSARRARATRP